MNEQVKRWYSAMGFRRSRRTYINKPIEKKEHESLDRLLSNLNGDYMGVRMSFLESPFEEVFQSSIGPYGKITGAPSCLAIIINEQYSRVYERAGFLGQKIVLEATSLGLSTCWVGGSFDDVIAAKNLGVMNKEKVIAVIPIGYARKNFSLTEKMMNQMPDFILKMDKTEIVNGKELENCPSWIATVIQAAQKAPSVRNRQPWRFFIGDDYSIKISVDEINEPTTVPKQIDCGIVMAHVDITTKYLGINGVWEYLESPDVAKFKLLD